jgi:hypothetical protein
MPLDFAKPKLVEVFGQKAQNGLTGLELKGHFFTENNEIVLGLEMNNQTGQALAEFDIKINTNPFAIFV